jgi:hypothetical protein
MEPERSVVYSVALEQQERLIRAMLSSPIGASVVAEDLCQRSAELASAGGDCHASRTGFLWTVHCRGGAQPPCGDTEVGVGVRARICASASSRLNQSHDGTYMAATSGPCGFHLGIG